jgi:kinesin family protein 11
MHFPYVAFGLCAFPDSLLLDHKTTKMIETNSTTFSDHLELLNEKHSEGAESIRNMTSNCLEKDYMVSSVDLFRLKMKKAECKDI